MTEIKEIKFKILDRELSFKMTYDRDFIADASTFYYFERAAMPEPEVVHLMVRVLKERDVVIDVGANVGFFTLLMATLVGPTGHVYAFEPGVNNISKLIDNIQLNRLSKYVTVYQDAVWSEPSERTLYLSADSGQNSLHNFDQSVGTSKVRTTTLDNMNVMPKLLKIDAEGAEYGILQGATDMLDSRVPYVVCELNARALANFTRTINDVRQLLGTYGYDMFLLNPDGAFPTYIPAGVPLVSSRENLNVLFSTIRNVSNAWPEIIIY